MNRDEVFGWDILISYASEERGWVEENVHEPLSRCRMKNGQRPRIFFDVSGEGVRLAGGDFMSQLAYAILHSHKYVPVYSELYFQKRMCKWELTKCVQPDPLNEMGKLCPILKDPAFKEIPHQVNLIPYVSIENKNWFMLLCYALELTPEEPPVLEFIDQPPEVVYVNHTISKLQVRVKKPDTVNSGDESISEEEITINAEGEGLQGLLTVKTIGAVATFVDLSFDRAIISTRLLATAQGCRPAYSHSFTVTPFVEDGPRQPEGAAIYATGEAIFFNGGKAVAIIGEEQIRTYDVKGNAIGDPVRVTGPLRLIKQADSILALVDWYGNISILFDNGQSLSWSPGEPGDDMTSPGGIAVTGNSIYVGFWSGRLFQLIMPKCEVNEMRYEPGVQALDVVDNRLYVVGLDGKLRNWDNDRFVELGELEPTIHLLKAYPDRLVGVGDENLHQYRISTGEFYRERLPITNPMAVLGDVDLPVVIDTKGRGLRFDAGIVNRVRFYVTAGALPVSADNAGRYCVFRNPDGSRTLMVESRVIFTHPIGTLAVAPEGNYFAIGSENCVQVVEKSTFDVIVETTHA